VVQHALLVSPALGDKRGELLGCLTGMVNDSSDKSLLGEMGMPNGWQAMEQEDAEFMIDMMDTLLP
jgi:phosphonate transport system substrate-binding protein